MKSFLKFLLIIVLLLAACGCETKLNEGDVIVMPQKNPDYKSNTINKNTNNINNSQNISVLSNNSQNVASNFYFSPPGKVLDMIPHDKKWLDFEVYDRYIFLIGKSGETNDGVEFGTSIMTFDTEGQSYINTFGDTASEFISITVFKGFIYAYDYLKGELHKYNTIGDLKEKLKLESKHKISKLKFSEAGWLTAMIDANGKKSISVFNENFSNKNVLEPIDLSDKPDLDIIDFDIYDEEHIILKASDGNLYLYDFKHGKIVNKRYIGQETCFFCYNQNILYSTFEKREGVLTKNSIQMAYIASPEKLGRLFLNSEFPWDSDKTLDEWTLEPLEIPGDSIGLVHNSIKSWGRFVYILDYNIVGTPSNRSLESYIIRVEK